MASMEPEHEAALEPVGRADAVRLTEQLRAAIAEARHAAVVLAGRVQEAHRARVWVPLGYSGWGQYAQAATSPAGASTPARLAGTVTSPPAPAAACGLSPGAAEISLSRFCVSLTGARVLS
ncbi:hypothetical protein [Streptomyces sp. NPDC058394]|uniref:hypothetical protein n=1 Tax=Streptomyces sp. NPDC058394 TaxID=3346477 RepID=UPI003649C7BD